MDFVLSDEQEMLRNNSVDFIKDAKVAAWIEHAYQTKEFPYDFMRAAAHQGYLGMMVRERYGGAGLNFLDALIAFGPIAFASSALSLCVLAQETLFNSAVRRFGSEDQKEKYLPRSVKGELFGCVANTEPGVGSDAKNIRLKAERRGDKWILNGTKCFITSASVAKAAVVSTRTAKRRSGHPGTTAFLIDVGDGMPGYTLDRVEEKIGQHGAPLCQFTLTDYETRDENILGKLHGGWKVFDETFQRSRVFIGMQAVELAQRAFNEMVFHTSDHKAFGKSVFDQSRPEIANLHLQIQAARLLCYTAADFEVHANPRFVEASSLAKLAGAEAALASTLFYFQKCGALSYLLHSQSSRLLLDALAIPIYEGPSEIQRLIIAKQVLEFIKHVRV